MFTYPPEFYTEDIQIHWKRLGKNTSDAEEKKAFVFHPNDTFVHDTYRGKTKLIGNKDKGNCSLMIQDIKESKQNIYVSIYIKGEQHCFKENTVSISLPGKKNNETFLN